MIPNCNNSQCKDCKHFMQHYVFSDGAFHWAYCGHCIQPKLRSKKPDSKICDHFETKSCDDEPNMTKKYLTKRLLEYFLSLVLPPQLDK